MATFRATLPKRSLRQGPGQDPSQFYCNSHIVRFAAIDPAPFSLRQLIFFGKFLGRHGSNLKEIESSLVKGANLVRAQLPIRLARQIRDFQSLPYIVTSNQNLTETYKLYVEAFEKIRAYPEIRNGEENQEWCEFLGDLLCHHKIVIPQLAIGIAESAHHLTNHQIEEFMTRMLHSRISRRVIVEHHIALTRQFQRNRTKPKSMRYLGIIDTELEVGKVVQRCIQLASSSLAAHGPRLSDEALSVQVGGEKGAKFAYIPDHLEYIVFELLLNAFRATYHHASLKSVTPSSLPITIQIASSTTHITIRISDNAGGIPQPRTPSFAADEAFPPTVCRREMFSFFDLAKGKDSLKGLIRSGGMEGRVREQMETGEGLAGLKETEEVQEARLRIGLPLSSIFAQFLGGSLEMYSIPGSADAVLCIPKLGTVAEPKCHAAQIS